MISGLAFFFCLFISTVSAATGSSTFWDVSRSHTSMIINEYQLTDIASNYVWTSAIANVSAPDNTTTLSFEVSMNATSVWTEIGFVSSPTFVNNNWLRGGANRGFGYFAIGRCDNPEGGQSQCPTYTKGDTVKVTYNQLDGQTNFYKNGLLVKTSNATNLALHFRTDLRPAVVMYATNDVLTALNYEYVAPTTAAPVTQAPTSETPSTAAPTTAAPTTPATTTPTTAAPSTPVPTTATPTTPSSTTQVPTTLPPTTVIPTTIMPTTATPTAPNTAAPTEPTPTTPVPTTVTPTTAPTMPPIFRVNITLVNTITQSQLRNVTIAFTPIYDATNYVVIVVALNTTSTFTPIRINTTTSQITLIGLQAGIAYNITLQPYRGNQAGPITTTIYFDTWSVESTSTDPNLNLSSSTSSRCNTTCVILIITLVGSTILTLLLLIGWKIHSNKKIQCEAQQDFEQVAPSSFDALPAVTPTHLDPSHDARSSVTNLDISDTTAPVDSIRFHAIDNTTNIVSAE